MEQSGGQRIDDDLKEEGTSQIPQEIYTRNTIELAAKSSEQY